jgi:hypothetical protein
LVGLDACGNGPTGNTVIRTEIKIKKSPLTFLSKRHCGCIHFRTHSPRPHHHGVLYCARKTAACSTAPATKRRAAPCPSTAACLSPHRHSPHAAEFSESTRHGPRRLLLHGILHCVQPLAYCHPPSPLHPSAACWLPQFSTR